jgi:PAS domain S-box-containing protein
MEGRRTEFPRGEGDDCERSSLLTLHVPDTPMNNDAVSFSAAAFLQGLPLGYAAVRCDGSVAEVNPSLARTIGYDVSELVGRVAADFVFDDANRRLFREQMTQRATGKSGAYELLLRSQLGHRVPVACFAVPQFLDDGSYWGSRGIVVPFVELERFDSLINSLLGGAPGGPPSSVPGLAQPDEAVERLLGMLTRRERDVVKLLRSGLRVQGVAECLSLSHYTVRNHLKRIFRKAGVTSQGELLMKLNGPMLFGNNGHPHL